MTSLADSGPGTLRDGIVNRTGPRTIVFNVAGTITLTNGIVINKPYLTIDGATAPLPGITIKQTTVNDSLIIGGTHDIIIHHLRLWGAWAPGGSQGDLLAIDGDAGPDFVAQRIVLDHLTMRGSGDGAPDIFGEVRDVTVSWCLVFNNLHPTTITYTGSQVRQRISVHHNVYARNDERNPQVRGDVRDFDYVNNIVYDWGYYAGWGYGMRIRNVGGEASVNANVVNNAFLAGTVNPAWGLVYGSDAGPDAEDGGPGGSPPQGTVVTTTNLGSLWVSGNVLPSVNMDQYSTVAAPLPVPAPARVTTWPAAELGVRLIPGVGTVFPDTAEQALLAVIAALMGGGSPSLSINDVSVSEGHSGPTTATLAVSLSVPSGQTVTVNYATSNGTATAGSDYVAASGMITFPPGVTTRPLNVTVLGDVLDESNETFFVNLTSPANATISDGQGVGTIQDDDAPPVMSIDDCAVTEGNAGSVVCAFTVSLSAPSSWTITVNYATANGSATAGTDYTAVSSGLTFTPGQVSKPVSVSVQGDTAVEVDEDFFVNLTGTTNATVGDAQGQGLIRDDDAPSLSSNELVHGAMQMADLAVDPGPVADVDLYRLGQDPRASYEVVIDGTSGDIGPGVSLERLASDNTTVLQTASPVGTGSSMSLRWENVLPGKVAGQHIRVRSGGCTTDCGTDDVYRIRAYETTYAIPRFSNAGSQVTVLQLQNPTAYTISGHVYFWDGAGVLLYSHAFSLAPKALLGLSAGGIPALQGKSGTMTVSSDGRYGDLTGKAVALEPATGFSFDSPMVPRP